ncbi:MAG: hypothetical protein NC117_05930 [Pseudoflavonifractor sp.]|nr:hypothetical protein [Pseudoflavonifractor sp.]
MRRLGKTIIMAAVISGSLAACDEGRIYDDTAIDSREGVTVRLSGRLSGLDTWPGGYSVVVAGFDDRSDYALISKSVGYPDADGLVEVEMTGVGEGVTTVELCVVNRLRQRVATFASVPAGGGRVIDIDAGTVDVSMFGTVQSAVFSTTCANCHGASNHAAAGLYLTEGHSYGSLVSQPSVKDAAMMRVSLGDASSSMLYQALATDVSTSWNYDHTKEIISIVTLDLIKDWIDGGARQ